ncbi:MAG: hypothetical protein J2P45_19175 [Candidatus Dormibacteraeota bacterium]|nr:hypothetical protein [Candidatus Dormibacteraeota bacterium]
MRRMGTGERRARLGIHHHLAREARAGEAVEVRGTLSGRDRDQTLAVVGQ